MKLVTIFTKASILTEAQLVCSRLEAAGFHPFVANENTAVWLGGYSMLAMSAFKVPETEAAEPRNFSNRARRMTPAKIKAASPAQKNPARRNFS